MLHAEDDPVCVPSFCPMLTQTASSNRNVIVLMTKRGGHSGWHQVRLPPPLPLPPPRQRTQHRGVASFTCTRFRCALLMVG